MLNRCLSSLFFASICFRLKVGGGCVRSRSAAAPTAAFASVRSASWYSAGTAPGCASSCSSPAHSSSSVKPSSLSQQFLKTIHTNFRFFTFQDINFNGSCSCKRAQCGSGGIRAIAHLILRSVPVEGRGILALAAEACVRSGPRVLRDGHSQTNVTKSRRPVTCRASHQTSAAESMIIRGVFFMATTGTS